MDVSSISRFLMNQNWDILLNSSSIEDMWQTFTSKIQLAIDLFVPSFTQSPGKIARYPKHIRKLLNRKKILWRNRNFPNGKVIYKLFAEKCKKAIDDHSTTKEVNILNSNNLNSVFTFVNKQYGNSEIGPIRDSDDILKFDSITKCKIMNKYNL